MTAFTGRALVLKFKGTAIESDYRSFEPSEEIKVESASAGADVPETYLTTLTDGKASLTMRSIAGTAGTALWITTLALGAEGTLEWMPQGTASIYRRSYVNAIVTGKNETNEYAGVVEWKIDWQYSGAITHTTNA
jgi:hypothetical protein